MEQLTLKYAQLFKNDPNDKLIGFIELNDETRFVHCYSFVTPESRIYDVLVDQDGGSETSPDRYSGLNPEILSIEPTHKYKRQFVKVMKTTGYNDTNKTVFEYLSGPDKGKQSQCLISELRKVLK